MLSMRNVPPNLYSIRGVMGCCHLLVDQDSQGNSRVVMIDTGMIGESFQIRYLLRRLCIKERALTSVILTHGHLDHAGNLAWFKERCGAEIYAHPLEQIHINGEYPYQGINKWCGKLEAVGRVAFRTQSVSVDKFFQEGDELPFWSGLRVVHMPGHTEGHCGFYSKKYNLLFSGDMFASYFFNVHMPPAILNSRPELFRASYEKMRALNSELLVPSHYDVLDGKLHKRRFDSLYERRLKFLS